MHEKLFFLQVQAELRILQQASREIGKIDTYLVYYNNNYAAPLLLLTPPLYLVSSDVSQETVDSTAAFLFNLFIGEPQLTRANAEEIRRTLGPFPASAATKASTTVKNILTYLPKDSPFTSSSQETSSTSDKQIQMKKKEFGHNISFKFDTETSLVTGDGDHVKSKLSNQTGYDSLSEDESTVVANGDTNIFTQTILSGMQQTIRKPDKKKAVTKKQPVVESRSTPVLPYSGEWLKAQCKEVVRGGHMQLSGQELYLAIFEQLSSGQENEAIENDVSCIEILIFVAAHKLYTSLS